MKIKILLILSILSVFLICSCDTAQELFRVVPRPAAHLAGLHFGEIDLKSATLLFDVEVTNPYSVALPLLNLDYAVASGDNPLFQGAADIQTTIPARSSRAVTLPVKIGYMDLLNALADLKDVQPGSSVPYSADVGLSVDTEALGPLRLPLRKTGDLTIPKLPQASDWRDILNRTLSQ